MAQKIVQYQAVLQLAQTSPQFYNMPLLHRQMLDVLGLKEAHKLVPLPEDQKPQDPVTENQCILMGKPVKAFAYQDHEAHIIVHTSAMQDPKVVAIVGQSPQAQALQGAMQAHIAEHLGFGYRVEIEKQLGMNLPPQLDDNGEEAFMDPEVEARLAPMLAQAAQRLLQTNQAAAAQQQAQQQAQDPMVQLQQAEMQLKKAEIDRKVAKDRFDAQAKMQSIDIERKRVEQQGTLDSIRIGAKATQDKSALDAQQKAEGLRMGIDAAQRNREFTEKVASHISGIHSKPKGK